MHGAFQEAATLSPIAFWFLRHGETDWNAQGISQGNVDIPLNAVGVAQARAAADKLRNRGIATIVASPLSRARVTAEFVGEALGLPVALDPDLREVSFGVQEGQGMSGWFADWVSGAFTPGRGRDVRGVAPARGRCGQSRDPNSRRQCLLWRTARCSARCARRWASSRTCERRTRCRSSVNHPIPGTTSWTLKPVV